ncbi:hypothetical protein QAD02_010346 [Eretmocerus hayati]|uniref:Uncharacterized protein n=1 Tax=Eretmocerus hayati TaxID=131215 RepID=A0ACC2NCJ7_9HYME|nr:hypothetical protein QAD02_010346 [Eretmocerus hayati]
METPAFSSEPDYGMKWKIFLYPNGVNNKNKGFVSVYLHLLSNNNKEPQAQVRCTFSILNSSNQVKQTRFLHCKMHKVRAYGYPRFVARADLENRSNKDLTNGKLILHCNIKASTGQVDSN